MDRDAKQPIDYSVPSPLRPDAIILTDDRTVSYILLVAGSVLIAIGLIVIYYVFDSYTIGIWLALFGVVFIAGATARLRTPSIRCVIDEAGITEYTTGLGLVTWSQITGARVAKDGGHAHLCLAVLDASAYRSRQHVSIWRPTARTRKQNEVSFSVGFLNKKSGEVLALIEQYRINAGQAANNSTGPAT